jgi:sortase (surface protein transpeptidase)
VSSAGPVAPEGPPSPAVEPDRGGRHISPARVIRRPAAVAALVAGLVIAGVGVAGFTVESQTGRAATPVGKPSHHALAPIPMGKVAAAPPAEVHVVARPVTLIIPAIGVRSRLVHLGLTRSGELQVPPVATVAGWYTGSPRPGEPGGAVIAGHIDSLRGPGVFFRLRLLHRGQRVFVRRANGSLAVFRVTSVRSYPKARFPSRAVYGPAPDAQLRLITCGGSFDPATGHYQSNTIVYAALVS